MRQLVDDWAPLLYLANGEKYGPSSVDYFLEHTQLTTSPNEEVTLSNIPQCTDSCYLETKEQLQKTTSKLDFFQGTSPSTTRSYAVVKEEGRYTHIYYWFFFPYNLGKKVCLGVVIRGCPCFRVLGKCVCPLVNKCVGDKQRFGNHVGDWEHIRVTLLDKQEHSIELSYHGNEVLFNFNGNDFKASGHSKIQFLGTHPIAYIAKGNLHTKFLFLNGTGEYFDSLSFS